MAGTERFTTQVNSFVREGVRSELGFPVMKIFTISSTKQNVRCIDKMVGSDDLYIRYRYI